MGHERRLNERRLNQFFEDRARHFKIFVILADFGSEFDCPAAALLRAELEPIRPALGEPVRALLESGASGFRAKSGFIDLKLVRFWNGTGILQGRLLGTGGWSRGPVFSLVDRRSLRQEPPTDLERMLFSTMLNLEV